MTQIHINQLGYRSQDMKKAVLPADTAAFSVIRSSDNQVVYEGVASSVIDYAPAAEKLRLADFSNFTEEGTFYLQSGDARSYTFSIAANVYEAMRKALLQMFISAKCGVDLDFDLWSHPACHSGLAKVHGSDLELDVHGGWHDAGDYGRYISPAAVTVADLLLAHEYAVNPDPELLDIVWFEIEWMLKMQDQASGGVYHKVTPQYFNALDEMPHDEHAPLYLSPISPTATADFAAVIAMAARFYPDTRDRLLNASKQAWSWCLAHPDAPQFKNPADIFTGEYGDQTCKDERLWAACELFVATGDEHYHDYIKGSELFTGLGWTDVGTYTLVCYLNHAGEKADPSVIERMKAKLLESSEAIMAEYEGDAYGVSLGMNYEWGSNLTVSNNAQTLLLASRFTDKSEAYRTAAMEHIHYLLGRNALSISYVTGFGSNAAKNPHHRPSVAIGQTVPGMLVGGPNMNTHQDPDLHERCAGQPPAKCYVDHIGSYAGNEITIYWNSAMYFVVAALDW